MESTNRTQTENDFSQKGVVLWWVMTFTWAALIFSLSTRDFGPSFSRGMLDWALSIVHIRLSRRMFELLHSGLRKLAHLTEYGIFALFLYFRPDDGPRRHWRPRRALYSVLVAAAYSLTDEFHQIFSPGRHASILDCGLDTVGAALAMLVPYAQAHFSFLRSNQAPSGDLDFAKPSIRPK
jgi:VanZ family protein